MGIFFYFSAFSMRQIHCFYDNEKVKVTWVTHNRWIMARYFCKNLAPVHQTVSFHLIVTYASRLTVMPQMDFSHMVSYYCLIQSTNLTRLFKVLHGYFSVKCLLDLDLRCKVKRNNTDGFFLLGLLIINDIL